MNKKLIALVGAASISLLGAYETASGLFWPAEEIGMYDSQLSTGGYLYTYGDEKDGGTSTTIWTHDTTEYGGPNLNPDGSVSFRMSIGPGAENAYTAMGMDFQEEQAEDFNLSAAGGFCLSYKSDGAAQFELKSTEQDAISGDGKYDSPIMTIPANPSGGVLDMPWASIKAENWSGDAISSQQAAGTALAVAIRLNGGAVRTVNFDLYQFGELGSCSAPGGGTIIPVLNKIANSSVNANLSGRTISFANLGKTNVNYELIGLNGQVVAKGVVNAAKNTVNLNKAGNGVYILRATSKDINFSKMLTIN